MLRRTQPESPTMSLTRPALKMTALAAQRLVAAAAQAAAAMGQPQCIAVVDEGCNLMAFLRMDGGRVLSIDSARHKAETAAATGKPTGNNEAELGFKLAHATGGRVTNLKGDDFISGHSAVTGPEVAYALLSAMTTAPAA